MLDMPKDILNIISTIENEGYDTYVVGGSVRDLLIGIIPVDWDLASSAPPEKIFSLFPCSKDSGKRFGVASVPLRAGTAEVASFRIDGNYSDHRRPDGVIFTDSIIKDLHRRDYTVNAMAFHPGRGLIDPFNGQKDLKERLLRTVGEPIERFTEDPLRILRGIRLAGQLGFDLPMGVFTAMQKTSHLTDQLSMDRRRREFRRLLVAKNAGKALSMCVSTGVLPHILGDSYPPKGRQDNGDFLELLQNIDKAKPDFELRMSLLLLCFEEKEAVKIVDRMGFDKETSKKLCQAAALFTDLYFTVDRYDLKRFIYLKGEETYNFVNEVAKQHRDVYDSPGFRIESRYYILEDIRNQGDPIYINQLAVDGRDLIKAGIVEGEKVGEMLSMLLDVVHRYPDLNTKPKLLKKAKELKKPWKARLRNIHFIK